MTKLSLSVACLILLTVKMNGQLCYDYWYPIIKKMDMIERVYFKANYEFLRADVHPKIRFYNNHLNNKSVDSLFNLQIANYSARLMDSTIFCQENYNEKGLLLKENGKEFHIDHWRTITRIYQYDSSKRITSETLLNEDLDTIDVKEFSFDDDHHIVKLKDNKEVYVLKYNRSGFLDTSIKFNVLNQIENFTKYAFDKDDKFLTKFKDSSNKIECRYKFDVNNNMVLFEAFGRSEELEYKSVHIYNLNGELEKTISTNIVDTTTETTYYLYTNGGNLEFVFKLNSNGEFTPIQKYQYDLNRLKCIINYDNDGSPKNKIYVFDKLH